MLKYHHLWRVLLICLLLQACSTSTPRTAPVENRTTAATSPRDIQSSTPNAIPPAPAPPAIAALLDDAEQAEAGGNPEVAAATLERALKIDANNALLWNRLAGVHLRRGDAQQALMMARKSNTLAAGNHELQLENWFLILAVMTETGNAEGTAEARRKIEDLRRLGAGTSG